MNYCYITGTGSGIGRAIALLLLEDNNSFVYGLSRTNSISHSRFVHIKIDLSDISETKSFNFSGHNGADSVSLINNAGILGPVNPIGKIDPEKINEVLNINFISPFILSDSFIKKFQSGTFVKTIINISSGAGRHPYESWSLYCSTKASLDMMSRVAASEQKLMPKDIAINIFSVAPGIVDTRMQAEIRNISELQFPRLKTFIDYYKNKLLDSPEEVAEKLVFLLKNPSQYQDVLLDIRNL